MGHEGAKVGRRGRVVSMIVGAIAVAVTTVAMTPSAASAVPSHFVYVAVNVKCPSSTPPTASAHGVPYDGTTARYSVLTGTTGTRLNKTFTFRVQLIANQTAHFEGFCALDVFPYNITKYFGEKPIALTYNPAGKHYSMSFGP